MTSSVSVPAKVVVIVLHHHVSDTTRMARKLYRNKPLRSQVRRHKSNIFGSIGEADMKYEWPGRIHSSLPNIYTGSWSKESSYCTYHPDRVSK